MNFNIQQIERRTEQEHDIYLNIHIYIWNALLLERKNDEVDEFSYMKRRRS